jgi:hypothetical protein
MLTITITGGRGEGKTTTALRILAFLRALGQDPEYQAVTKERSRWLIENLNVLDGSEPRKIVIVDQDCTDDTSWKNA